MPKAQYIMENGKIICHMVMEKCFLKMDLSMKEYSMKAVLMERVDLSILMEFITRAKFNKELLRELENWLTTILIMNIKVTGIEIYLMERELKNGEMDQFMKVNSKTVLKKELGNTIKLENLTMRELLKTIK